MPKSHDDRRRQKCEKSRRDRLVQRQQGLNPLVPEHPLGLVALAHYIVDGLWYGINHSHIRFAALARAFQGPSIQVVVSRSYGAIEALTFGGIDVSEEQVAENGSDDAVPVIPDFRPDAQEIAEVAPQLDKGDGFERIVEVITHDGVILASIAIGIGRATELDRSAFARLCRRSKCSATQTYRYPSPSWSCGSFSPGHYPRTQ